MQAPDRHLTLVETTLREERERGVGEHLTRGLVAAAGRKQALLEQSRPHQEKGRLDV
jgi:hypothetical protein